jgi:formylglycine-generating enzyme
MTNDSAPKPTRGKPKLATPAHPARKMMIAVGLPAVVIAASVVGWEYHVARRTERLQGRQTATTQLAALVQQRAAAHAGGDRLVAALANGAHGDWQRLAASVRKGDAAPDLVGCTWALFDESTGALFADMKRALCDAAEVLAQADGDLQRATQGLDAATAALPAITDREQRLAKYLSDSVWAAAAAAHADPAFAAILANAPSAHVAAARSALLAGEDTKVADALAQLRLLVDPARVAKWQSLHAATRPLLADLTKAAARPDGATGAGPADLLRAAAARAEPQWRSTTPEVDAAAWEQAIAHAERLLALAARAEQVLREADAQLAAAAAPVPEPAWRPHREALANFRQAWWTGDASAAEAALAVIPAGAALRDLWLREAAAARALLERWERVPEQFRGQSTPDAGQVFATAIAGSQLDIVAFQSAQALLAKATAAASDAWYAKCIADVVPRSAQGDEEASAELKRLSAWLAGDQRRAALESSMTQAEQAAAAKLDAAVKAMKEREAAVNRAKQFQAAEQAAAAKLAQAKAEAAAKDRLRGAGLVASPGSPTDEATGFPRKVVHSATGAELVLIAAGEFTMGSPADELMRDSDEVQHRRQIRKPFYLGVTEVTQAQWRKVMGSNPSKFQGDDLPVEQISWEDCQQFLQKAGGGLRLPSEAEWEYSCRAGTTTPFSFGATITPAQVNYDGNYPYGGGSKGLYRERTVAAGSLPANAWGLHEMHGNVWELCQDGYEAYPGSGTEEPSRDTGARVLRGGSWFFNARGCRAANRDRFEPGNRNGNVGLRLARTLPE